MPKATYTVTFDGETNVLELATAGGSKPPGPAGLARSFLVADRWELPPRNDSNKLLGNSTLTADIADPVGLHYFEFPARLDNPAISERELNWAIKTLGPGIEEALMEARHGGGFVELDDDYQELVRRHVARVMEQDVGAVVAASRERSREPALHLVKGALAASAERTGDPALAAFLWEESARLHVVRGDENRGFVALTYAEADWTAAGEAARAERVSRQRYALQSVDGWAFDRALSDRARPPKLAVEFGPGFGRDL